MSGSVRIGLIGCGRLAEAGYLPAAAAASQVELVAVADPDPERRQIVVAMAGERIAAHASLEDLIAAGGVDAVVIATPPRHHEEAARLAAEHGLPALIEKPPAPDATGAAHIAFLEPAPWIGFNRRFSLGYGLADALPNGGSIALELRYRRFSWAPVSVRDPALIDLAPHLIDLALRAGVKLPLSVSASSRRPERISIDLVSAHGGARISCACDRPHRERATVRSADGEVVAARRIGGLIRGATMRLRPGAHPLVASLIAQLEEFAVAARGGSPGNLATAADGLRAMRVVSAAAASLARGGEEVAVEIETHAA